MSYELDQILTRTDDAAWRRALHWAGAFIAGFSSAQTRRSYQRDLHCWFGFCAAHGMHPYKGVRRTHVELYLRELEAQLPRPSNATLYRRISTLSSWFSWLEDEEVIVGNPAARVRRPSRHPHPQPCKRSRVFPMFDHRISPHGAPGGWGDARQPAAA
ncbi:MAG: site-specific integrase [Egibacteraceae bacterium]